MIVTSPAENFLVTPSSVSLKIKPRILRAATVVTLIFISISGRPSTLPTATVHFEVVSIRRSSLDGFHRNFNITPDGYHVRGQSLWGTIAFAYYPLPLGIGRAIFSN